MMLYAIAKFFRGTKAGRFDATRNAFQITLSCDRCGTDGIADVSQTTIGYSNRFTFDVDHVSKGFFVADLTNSPATVEICCTRCHRPAKLAETADRIVKGTVDVHYPGA